MSEERLDDVEDKLSILEHWQDAMKRDIERRLNALERWGEDQEDIVNQINLRVAPESDPGDNAWRVVWRDAFGEAKGYRWPHEVEASPVEEILARQVVAERKRVATLQSYVKDLERTNGGDA